MEHMLVNYVKLLVNEETKSNLIDYCKVNRLGIMDVEDQSTVDVNDFSFHITVIVSKTLHEKFLDEEHEIYPLKFVFDKFEMFGPKQNILALKMNENHLFTNLHNHYISNYGHTTDYPPNPHLSIEGDCSRWSDRLNELPKIDFDIVTNKLIHLNKKLKIKK